MAKKIEKRPTPKYITVHFSCTALSSQKIKLES